MQCFPFYSWDLQIRFHAKLQLSAEMLTINWLKENSLDVRIVNKRHVRHDSSDTTFPRMQWKLSGERVWTCGIEKNVKTWNRTSVFLEQRKKRKKVALLHQRFFCVSAAMHFGILSPVTVQNISIPFFTLDSQNNFILSWRKSRKLLH